MKYAIIYDKYVSDAVSVLQKMYQPIYNDVPIEMLADAILWDADEDYYEHGNKENLFYNGVLNKDEFYSWLLEQINYQKKEYGIDYLSSMCEVLHNNQ